MDAKAEIIINSGIEWISDNTTIDTTDLSNFPSSAKLFLIKFYDLQKLRTGVTSQSIEGLSQSFDTSGIDNKLWQDAAVCVLYQQRKNGGDSMGVKYAVKKDAITKMLTTIQGISSKKVQVGAFKGEHAWLAGVHEYGCTITPKNAKYLTVPVHPKAKGKRASEFSDLWTLKADSGELFLCRNTGKDSFEVLYWLTRSVKIPERSFLRTGHDENADRVIKQTERALPQVIDGKMSVDTLLDTYGQQMATAIKTQIRNLSSPANSSATTAAKGTSNPLKDTGGLIESIDWKVE